MNILGPWDPRHAFDLVSAFAGTVVALFVQPGIRRWEAIGIVVTGLIAAYFGTSYLAGFLPPGDGVRGVAGLAIGMLSFVLAGRAISTARSGRLPFIGREGSDER